MNIKVRSPYQSLIEFDGQKINAIGPLSLLNRLQELKSEFGNHPKAWLLAKPLRSNDEVLIDELIHRVQNQAVLPYPHEELCHCRMVPAEKVHNAIKQGCRKVNDIARTTLAGTGCGTCRKDTEEIFATFSIQD